MVKMERNAPFMHSSTQSAVLRQALLQNWDSLLSRAGFLLLCCRLIPHTAPTPTCVMLWSGREGCMEDGSGPSAQHHDGSCEINPLCQEQRQTCQGLSWLHVVTPKCINAWGPTLSFLHQPPQLIPGSFHTSRMMCLVTAHTGQRAALCSLLGKLVHHTLEPTPLSCGWFLCESRSALTYCCHILLTDKCNKTCSPQPPAVPKGNGDLFQVGSSLLLLLLLC